MVPLLATPVGSYNFLKDYNMAHAIDYDPKNPPPEFFFMIILGILLLVWYAAN